MWLYGFAIWWAAAIVVAVAFHLIKKRSEGKTIMVAFVTHGRKYHKDEACYRMEQGENLHDYDGDDYWFHAGTYRKQVASIKEAAYLGKLPCTHCVPVSERMFPPLYGQTFGHEPILIDGDLFCGVCRDHGVDDEGDSWSYPSLWPCMSAKVLGLFQEGK